MYKAASVNSTKVTLGFGALLFLCIGIGGLLAPGQLVAAYDLAPGTVNADNELRAVYGGILRSTKVS